MQTFKKFLALVVLSIPTFSFADVNLQTGGYVRRFVDYKIQWKKHPFSFERIYRSRSLHQGFFGFGWCSFLDEKLKFQEKSVQIDFCDDETRSVLKNKSKDLWLSPTARLSKTKKGYLLVDKNKGQRLYDLNGWLIRFENEVEITRDKNGVPLHFEMGLNRFTISVDNLNRNITQIFSNSFFTTEYQYEKGQLSRVLQNKNLLQNYVYDEDDNLIQINNSKNENERIVYDKNQDRVSEWQSKDSCPLIYIYDQLNSVEMVTQVLRQCGSKKTTLAEVHFFYESLSNGSVHLVRHESQTRALASDNGLIYKRDHK